MDSEKTSQMSKAINNEENETQGDSSNDKLASEADKNKDQPKDSSTTSEDSRDLKHRRRTGRRRRTSPRED